MSFLGLTRILDPYGIFFRTKAQTKKASFPFRQAVDTVSAGCMSSQQKASEREYVPALVCEQ